MNILTSVIKNCAVYDGAPDGIVEVMLWNEKAEPLTESKRFCGAHATADAEAWAAAQEIELRRIDALAAIDQISWDGGFPSPPEGWEIVLVDPGSNGNFSDLDVGDPVYADGTETFLGYAWGDTQSLIRPRRVPED